MRHGRLSSRPPRAQGLCKVTVLVPKDCAEGIRQFAEELRARRQVEPTPTRLEWRALSPWLRDLPKKVKLLCEELLVFREPIVR
jgi:hypothetical protein